MKCRYVGLTKSESKDYFDLKETPLDNCTRSMVKRYFKLKKKIIKALNERV